MLVGTNVSHTVSCDTVTRGKTRRPTQHTDRRCETSFETKTNYFIVRRWLNIPARSARLRNYLEWEVGIEKKKKKKSSHARVDTLNVFFPMMMWLALAQRIFIPLLGRIFPYLQSNFLQRVTKDCRESKKKKKIDRLPFNWLLTCIESFGLELKEKEKQVERGSIIGETYICE